MDERPISRRRTRRAYRVETLPGAEAVFRQPPHRPNRADDFVDAGRLTSAFRRELRERGIDHRMARVLLCMSPPHLLRPRDVAWRLGVARSTASAMLDDAERLGLVDKVYMLVDRRGTWARLTARGRARRRELERLLASVEPSDARFGVAYGIRGCSKWDY